MYCKYCGAALPEGAKFCQSCGQATEAIAEIQAVPSAVEGNNYYQQQPVQNAVEGNSYYQQQPVQNVVKENNYYQQQPVQGSSEKVSATPGFVCSIIGIFFFGLILGIVGLVLSNKALKQGCENVGLAKAGKIVGIIDICLYGFAILIILIAG